MKKSPHHIKHQQKKELRAAQNQPYETEKKEIKKKAKKRALTSFRTNKITKAKTASKRKSHKTSPQDTTWETEPDSIHKEGNRWIQIVQKQILDKARYFQKKMQKFNLTKRKK